MPSFEDFYVLFRHGTCASHVHYILVILYVSFFLSIRALRCPCWSYNQVVLISLHNLPHEIMNTACNSVGSGSAGDGAAYKAIKLALVPSHCCLFPYRRRLLFLKLLPAYLQKEDQRQSSRRVSERRMSQGLCCSRYIFFFSKFNLVHHLHVILEKDNVAKK